MLNEIFMEQALQNLERELEAKRTQHLRYVPRAHKPRLNFIRRLARVSAIALMVRR